MDSLKVGQVSIKLQDLPEMGYTSNDKPYKRGLLWVKTNTMSPGYYMDEENTKKNIDEEGYFNTGDVKKNFLLFFLSFFFFFKIVEYDEASNHLKVIDRHKHFVKLAQSVFIAPEHLESLYVESRYVDFVYIDANIEQSFILAVVIPNKKSCIEKMKENDENLKENEEEEVWKKICEDPKKLKQVILADWRKIAKIRELKSYEIPRDIYIEVETSWTPDNGFLTPSYKNKRDFLSRFYQQKLSSIYERLGENQEEVNQLQG